MEPPYDFTRPLPNGMRVFLAAAGLFAIVMPAYEFWPAFYPPSLITLFFGFITLGAWWVGGNFVSAAIFGAQQHWQFRDGAILIDQQNIFRKWQTSIRKQDIATTEIRENELDGPNTFSVVFRLNDGRTLDTHGLDTHAAAEAMRNRILDYLGRT